MIAHRPKMLVIVTLIALLPLVAVAVSRPAEAEAHPLGNFTINRYSRLELYSDAVRVRYIVDMAEIPAFQELSEIDNDGDDEPSFAENEIYLARKAREIAGNLELIANGSELNVEVLAADIHYPEGQAGLRTLRMTILMHAHVSDGALEVAYSDGNYADHIGWKEVIVQPAAGVTLSRSSVPAEDRSAELTSYPDDLLSSPLDVTTASVIFDASDGAAAPPVEKSALLAGRPGHTVARPGGDFASLIDTKEMTAPVIALSLLLALGFGAIHALEPGHGKTFVAAYFVGVKGTVRQALALGLIIATTHTIGVLAIGMITLFASQYVLPEKLYPYLSLASGLMILALGARLIAARAGGWRALQRFLSIIRPASADGHPHAHHHSHEPEPGAPPWKSLLVLGLADGLTPSPSAIIVLLAAVSLDRIGLGIALIMAFSGGLALVLTTVSLALLYTGNIVERLSLPKAALTQSGGLSWLRGAGLAALTRFAPLCGAVALTVMGSALTLRALTAPGLFVF